MKSNVGSCAHLPMPAPKKSNTRSRLWLTMVGRNCRSAILNRRRSTAAVPKAGTKRLVPALFDSQPTA
jgi:hypothetical protein